MIDPFLVLATRVVEVEDGGLASYHGDYEYYLAKKGEIPQPSGQPSAASARAIHESPLQPLTQNSKLETQNLSKEERLRSREEEKQRQKEERQRQKRLAELERAIEVEEGRLAELEGRMADPAFFADREAARIAGEEHVLLSARIAGLYEEWETIHGE